MRPCPRLLMRYNVWCASDSLNRLGRCDAAVTVLRRFLPCWSRQMAEPVFDTAGVAAVAAAGTKSGIVEAAADTLLAGHMPLGGECSHVAAHLSLQ